MKIGDYNITAYNIGSYLRGNATKFAEDRGFGILAEYQKQQVKLRSILCSDCLEAGKCKICNCKTPNLFYDTIRSDSNGKWGPMMQLDKWTEFIKKYPYSHYSIEELATAYSLEYQKEKLVNNSNENAIVLNDTKQESTGKTAIKLNYTKDDILYDNGISKLNVPVKHTFTLTNTTDKDLSIVKVKPGCSCSSSVVNQGTNVAPNDEFKITITYNANVKGSYRKGTWVYFSNNIRPILLEVMGTIVA